VDAFKANRLLASFPVPILSLLEPHLRLIELRHGQNVQESSNPVKTVYFPTSGMISLVALTDGTHAVESGLAGREGAVNAFEAVHGLPAFGEAMVQAAGEAITLSAGHLRTIAQQTPEVVVAISRAHAALMAQARQSAACNATHSLESRLARWMLQTRDRVDSNTLPLTQEFMAIMLGVQRTSVTSTVGTLSGLKLIEQRRGSIEIVNPDGLKRTACDCYDIINDYVARLNDKVPTN
jgi:CRP-like cAMP-binding protein